MKKLLKHLELQLFIYQEQEAKAAKQNNYQKALYYSHKSGMIEDIIIVINNEFLKK